MAVPALIATAEIAGAIVALANILQKAIADGKTSVEIAAFGQLYTKEAAILHAYLAQLPAADEPPQAQGET